MRVGVPPPAQKIKVKNKNLILEHSQFMEQTIQKPSLPMKTKIAAWWTMIGGGFWFMYILWLGVIPVTGIFLIAPILLGLLLIISGHFILKQRKSGWWLALIILAISVFMLLGVPFVLLLLFPPLKHYFPFSLNAFFALIFYLLPFVLLFLDRKNFWKIAA